LLDPVGDEQARKSTRLLKKYSGRALLISTPACAMHCRYCFRQNFDYQKSESFTEEIDILRSDTSIHEVILSGGDPLSLSDEKLRILLDQLEGISHIKKIRFHTRFLLGIPERVDSSFLSILKDRRVQLYFVFHINHPKEIDEDLLYSAKKLRESGGILLNQSVLLKGVNDSCKTQLELHQALIDGGILPYYLHQLDRVAGTAHFEVDPDRGREIIEYLQIHLPGYGVPRYFQEIPNQPNKTPL